MTEPEHSLPDDDSPLDADENTSLGSDDGFWDAFSQDDEIEPLPEPGDIWIEPEEEANS